MLTIGRPFYPPFRYIGEDTSVIETYPSFFVVVAHFVQPASILDDDIPREKQMQIIAAAKTGLEMFLRQEPILKEFLPRGIEKGAALLGIVNNFFSAFAGTSGPHPSLSALRKGVDGFFISLQDEMDRLSTFTVTNKGNLAVKSLVAGASKQYPKSVLELLDAFITGEIDHAGKCLAFELPTACGFHILRAVEISVKAYVHAATGKLLPIKNRNWGEYILQLENAGAHTDLTDVLKILKTKCNPLMHPQDSLEIEEAIGLICICQSVIETLIADVRRHSLELTFKRSLELLPTQRRSELRLRPPPALPRPRFS